MAEYAFMHMLRRPSLPLRFSMPSLPAHIIPRQRVVTALEKALDVTCLVVLTAPLGHGKSTAAQELLGRWTRRSLYLRMKPGWTDNADYLWDETCAKLERQGMPGTAELKLVGFPNDDARMYRCLAFFREYLSVSPTLLVVDDFHHLDATPLTRFFESLVSEEIEGFNLLLLSRTRPALPLAYMQVKGYATVLDSALLDFSRDEARTLFAAAGEEESAPADAALEFSQGWAAALRLCLGSHLAENNIKPVRNIDELLSEMFRTTYSRDEQCLLLQLSVLETFSAAQAVTVSGDKEAPSHLRKLYEQNAFLQYSPSADLYSIHGLLRSFLLRTLAENSLAACEDLDIGLLYRRAAECSLQVRDFLQAMRLFAQAGGEQDLLRILRIFETPGEGFFILPDSETVLEIVENIPWSIRRQSPVGYLGFIHRYMVRVDRRKGGAMAAEAEAAFLADGVFPEETRRIIQGELALIRAIESFNDFEAMGRCYEVADSFLPGRSSLVNRNMFWTFNCPHSSFLYLKKQGGYEALEELVAEKLPYFQRLSDGSNAGAIELLTAERLLETGKLQKSVHILHTAKYKALESDQYTAILATNFTLARHHLAEGNRDDVYDIFSPWREPVEQRAHPALLHNLDVCTGYIAAVRNDVERIPSWLLQHAPLGVRNNQAHAFSLIVRGKAITTLKNWPRLLAFAEEIEPVIIALGSLFGRLHIALFKAIAASHMQKRTTALSDKYLLQALELAGPDGIITTLAEYGGHLYPLLQRFGNMHPERRDLLQLQRLTKKYAKQGIKRSSKLTVHEADIMEMVRSGANNKEIGARLGITQGSVANSLSRIYGKLGVGSRIEAVTRWVEEAEADGLSEAE